jgi:hypothetical protein
MPTWFRRKRPAPTEAVRDFVDTIEFINVLLAREQAEQERSIGSYRVGGYAQSTGTHTTTIG